MFQGKKALILELHNLFHPRFFSELDRMEPPGVRSMGARNPERRRVYPLWGGAPVRVMGKLGESHTTQSLTPPESAQATFYPGSLFLNRVWALQGWKKGVRMVELLFYHRLVWYGQVCSTKRCHLQYGRMTQHRDPGSCSQSSLRTTNPRLPLVTVVHSTLPLLESRVNGYKWDLVCWPLKWFSLFLVDSVSPGG